MTTIFDFTDPISYLNEVIKNNTLFKGYISKLAQAAGCQVSYFSQFLRNKTYLSPEQGMGISDFLGHSNLEAEYFLILFLIQKAATQNFKSKLIKKLDLLRNRYSNLTSRIQSESEVDLEIRKVSHLYFTSWLYGAIHVTLSIPFFQSDTNQKLSEKFNISVKKASGILSDLESLNLIKKENGYWVLLNNQIHLSQNSEMSYTNHQQWRQKSLVDVEQENSKSIHYSSVFALSKTDSEILKKNVLDFLEKSRTSIKNSDSEITYCMNLDLFEI